LLFGPDYNKFFNRGAGSSAFKSPKDLKEGEAAEIIPFEPDPGNAGVGSGDHSVIRSGHILSGEGVWLFL